MPIAEVNGTSLRYDVQGSGPPLVLVHGSPGEASTWLPVVPGFAEMFTVVTYDRRGFGHSGPPAGLPSVQRHVEDLAALIEDLELAPAHVAGLSGGANVALWLAIRYPELVARVAAHEPGFMLLLLADPACAALLEETGATMEAVVERLDAGDYRAAVETFIDGVVAPDAWRLLPEQIKEVFVRNAPEFHAELRAFDLMYIDTDALAKAPVPLLVTDGRVTTPVFAAIAERLTAACPNLERHTFATGHAPHWTEPAEFVSVVSRWLTIRNLITDRATA